MTGPEHYAEAERLLELADGDGAADAAILITEAQVHATLAHAAAIVDTGAQASTTRMLATFANLGNTAENIQALDTLLNDTATVAVGERMKAWVGVLS